MADLKNDKPTELDILGLVNHTHPPAAQLLNDSVVGNGLADQWRRSSH
jgi:hypothetical protein